MLASRIFDIAGRCRGARARDLLNIVSSFTFLPLVVVEKIV